MRAKSHFILNLTQLYFEVEKGQQDRQTKNSNYNFLVRSIYRKILARKTKTKLRNKPLFI